LKFKYLIIAFSIIIIIIILVTAFLPLTFASALSKSSPETISNFRLITIPLLIFMVLLLGGMGIFFFLNYRLLSLLEREDWPALAYYLEQKIYTKGDYSSRNVRLLASSYLVITDYQSVIKLEGKTMIARPASVIKNILVFGSARVLSGDHAEAAAFYSALLIKGKGKLKPGEEQWARWYHGFSLLLKGAFREAEPEFGALAASSKDALITGLSAYFLDSSIAKNSGDKAACLASAEKGKERVVRALKNSGSWKKEVAKNGSDIHIAIIKKYIDETGLWIYKK